MVLVWGVVIVVWYYIGLEIEILVDFEYIGGYVKLVFDGLIIWYCDSFCVLVCGFI